MSKILIIAEHASGQLNPSTAKCLTAAKQMGASAIDIAVFAADLRRRRRSRNAGWRQPRSSPTPRM